MGRLWQQAMTTKPSVAKTVIIKNPSALPQRSMILASGMNVAAHMELDTTNITFSNEWVSNLLVTNGRRLLRMFDWKALTR